MKMIDEMTKEIVCCIKFCFRPARKPNLMGVYSFVYLNEDKMAVYDAESMTTQVRRTGILYQSGFVFHGQKKSCDPNHVLSTIV